MSAQLLSSRFSPIDYERQKDSLMVKGWGSFSLPDRDNEKVPSPFEFNITEYMNCPQLLVNHRYIATADGNQVAAGQVKKAIPAYLAESPTSNKEWIVKSLTDDAFISTWLKSKSPRAQKGDEGLFLVAEVYNDYAIELVEKGELGAFSWKGLSYKQKNAGEADLIQEIDVVEFSLVHTQNQSSSTFVLTDKDDPALEIEVDIENCEIYKREFSKKEYDTNKVRWCTKNINIETLPITENESSYFIDYGGEKEVDIENSFSIQVGNRNLIAAPKIKIERVNVSHVGKVSSTPIKEMSDMSDENQEIEVVQVEKNVEPQRLYLLDMDTFKSRHPNAKVTVTKSTMLGELPVEISSIEIPAEEVVAEVTEPEQTEVVSEETTDEVVVEAVEETKVSELDKVLAAISQLTAVVSQTAVKQVEAETKQAELEAKVADQKTVEEVRDELKGELKAEVQKSLDLAAKAANDLEAQRQRLEKQASAFNSAIPTQDVRSEKVETQKSVDTDEPVNIFNSFGYVKEQK